MAKSTRTITLTELPAETYNALAELSNENGGGGIGDLCKRFIEEGIERQNLSTFTASPISRLFMAYRELQIRLSALSMLEALARDYQRNPSDDSLTRLQSLCDDYDITLDEVIARSNDKPVEAVGDIANAKLWLQQYAGAKVEVNARDTLDAGVSAGFKKFHLTKAKNELGWASIKRGVGYVWVVKQNVLSSMLHKMTDDG